MSGTERTPPARPGRPPRFSRDDVVRAAVDLADAEGLAAVTMRAVAARLGTGVMSLYGYVPDKRALVHAMVEFISADQEYPEPSGDWRADLHRLAHLQRGILLRHPWATDAVTHLQPIGEGMLAYLEYGLGALEPLDLDPPARMETLAMVTGVVLNLVRSELLARRTTADPQHLAAQQEEIMRLLATGRFPRFSAVMGAAAAAVSGHELDVAAEFDRLLDRVLDGLIPPGRARPGRRTRPAKP